MPEKYTEYRQYFLMIAQVLGVGDILDPEYQPPHRRYDLPAPSKCKEVNHWARRIQQGMAELFQLTVLRRTSTGSSSKRAPHSDHDLRLP